MDTVDLGQFCGIQDPVGQDQKGKGVGFDLILSLRMLGLPGKFNFRLLFIVSSLSSTVVSTFVSKI